MRLSAVAKGSRTKENASAAAMGVGGTVAAGGLVGGGIPGAKPNSAKYYRDVKNARESGKPLPKRTVGSHAAAAGKGGVFGYRQDAHERFKLETKNKAILSRNNMGEKLSDRVNNQDAHLHGAMKGKVAAEKRIIRTMRKGRVASNVALGAGGAVVAATAAERIRRQKKVGKALSGWGAADLPPGMHRGEMGPHRRPYLEQVNSNNGMLRALPDGKTIKAKTPPTLKLNPNGERKAKPKSKPAPRPKVSTPAKRRVGMSTGRKAAVGAGAVGLAGVTAAALNKAVDPKDRQNPTAALAAGATVAGASQVGGRGLQREGRKWAVRNKRELDAVRAMTPRAGGYETKKTKTGVPDHKPYTVPEHTAKPMGTDLNGVPKRVAGASGERRGAAAQARYFARTYGKQGKNIRRYGTAAGAAVAAGGLVGQKYKITARDEIRSKR